MKNSPIARLNVWFPVAIAAFAIICYSNSFGNPFIFDDIPTIKDNPHTRQLMSGLLTSRGVADLTFQLNYSIGAFKVADYHLVNLIIHIISGLLLYGIVRRTLLLPAMAERYAESSQILAFICALVWAVHPLQTESVTYICQRSEELAGMFCLLTIYCFVRSTLAAHTRLWSIFALLGCAAGMGTKQVMVAVPLIVLLYDVVFVGGSFRNAFRSRWHVHLALFLTIGILAVLLLGTVGATMAGGMHTVATTSSLQYLLTETQVLLLYLRLSIWPHPLCLDYGWQLASGAGSVLIPLAAVLLLSIGTVIALLRARPLGFIGAWFFLLLAPTSSLVPLDDPAFEHRMYLPLAGVVVMVVFTVRSALLKMSARTGLANGWSRTLGAAIVCLVVAALAVVTVSRNADYRSDETIWRSVVAVRPTSIRARVSLGTVLLKDGRDIEAEACLTNVLATLSDLPEQMTRRELNNYVMARDALGTLSYRHKDYKKAEDCFRDCMRLAPEYINASNNLGLALKSQGRTNEAVRLWTPLSKANTPSADACHYLGLTAFERGDFQDAVSKLGRATEINPDMNDARLDLCWILAACSDPEVRNPARAKEILLAQPEYTAMENVRVMDIMGIIASHEKSFGRAIKYGEAAIAQGRKLGMTGLDEIERRVEMYKSELSYP